MTSDAQIFTPQGPYTLISMNKMPGIPGLFARLITLSMVRPSRLKADAVMENTGLVFRNFKINPEKLKKFKQVCGYGTGPDAPEVPAPFIQTFFIGVISRFIGSAHFPINPMGLIQVGQSFEQKRPVTVDTPLDLHCRLRDMTQTERGIHTRFLMEAKTGEQLVWEGVATYFTRAKNPPPREKKDRTGEVPLPVRETISVPENTGRRYAAVSGDYNPHHLYGWTARVIGFKSAIAHGMWSLARSCASLEIQSGYPDTFKVEGALKLPIFLPGTITLGVDTGDDRTEFEIRDHIKGVPHLKGSFRF